jgi:hypothetical protein
MPRDMGSGDLSLAPDLDPPMAAAEGALGAGRFLLDAEAAWGWVS